MLQLMVVGIYGVHGLHVRLRVAAVLASESVTVTALFQCMEGKIVVVCLKEHPAVTLISA